MTTTTNTQQEAHKALAAIAEVINKMTGIADDKISQIAGEQSDAAARDALLVAYVGIDERMDELRTLLTRAYSIANDEMPAHTKRGAK